MPSPPASQFMNSIEVCSLNEAPGKSHGSFETSPRVHSKTCQVRWYILEYIFDMHFARFMLQVALAILGK